jgi:glycosyltransferase involved in cell wall biosynthesis
MSNLKKRKILFLHWGFAPIIGGVETHLALLGKKLVEEGHEVTLVTSTVSLDSRLQFSYCGMKVIRVPIMNLESIYDKQKKSPRKLKIDICETLEALVSEINPDIIHAHNLHYFTNVHAQCLNKISKNKNIPIVLTAHNFWDENICVDIAREINWDKIICVSHFIRQEFLAIDCDESKVVTIHHGIDENKFKDGVIDADKVYEKYPVLKGKSIIFHPARLGLAKGCDASVKALKIILKSVPNAHLVMAGDKNIIDWCHSQRKDIVYILGLVKRLKLEENILIHTFSMDEVREVYQIADVCWYPSMAFEPFGLVMLESMAFAKPTIVSNIGGMPEIIKNRKTGFVIPPKNTIELASKTTELLLNKNLRMEMGKNARLKLEEKYTLKHMTDKVMKVYDDVLEMRCKKVFYMNAKRCKEVLSSSLQ